MALPFVVIKILRSENTENCGEASWITQQYRLLHLFDCFLGLQMIGI